MFIRELISPCSNLLNAMLGCGITLFPEAFQTYGLIPSVGFIILSSILSILCLNLYITVNSRIGKSSTISTIALYIYPPLKLVADITIILQCLSCCLAYITLIKTQTAYILTLCNFKIGVWLPLYVFIIFVIFFSSLGKLDKLKFLSIMSVSSIIIVVIISAAILTIKREGSLPLMDIQPSLLGRVGTFIFAFTCHPAVLDVQNELNHQPLFFFQVVIVLVNIIGALIFIFFGIINSYIYDFSGGKEWLLVIENNALGIITRILVLIIVTPSIPLQMMIAIKCFVNLLNNNFAKSFTFRLFLSFISLTTIYIMSLTNIRFSNVIDLIGASVTIVVCFILPSLYYMLMDKKKKDIFNSIIAPLLIIIGVSITGMTIKSKYF
ncbi:Amino acid transporter [Spraguea lophii 42_110]|uniref:Amino acid transporter n=1 Tax=Spraguea lophii (strain 42_110) TaxID=1358809 RepID=S7W8F1_SPRLO|nr:Amino acid transporter [Spraguea lophii 42_110]